jgi:hypothetical protein
MTETHGRTLPPPAKPKRKGHEPPTAAEPPAPNGAAPAPGRPHEATPAPKLPPPVTTQGPRARTGRLRWPRGARLEDNCLQRYPH